MSQRIPVIIDTDMGVDDAYAVMLAFSSPLLKILGIKNIYCNTVVTGLSQFFDLINAGHT